jgi:hypothetical protein
MRILRIGRKNADKKFRIPIRYIRTIRIEKMNMYNEIIEPDKVLLEIPTSKAVLFTMFALNAVCVPVWIGLGIGFGVDIPVLLGCMIILIVFHGIGALWLAVRLFSSPTGIIITVDGFYDYYTACVQVFVAWKDVTLITTRWVQFHPWLLVRLNNPKEYIARESNPFRRHLQWGNYFLMGTPITISPFFFWISIKELKRLMTEQYENYRERELQQ